MDNPKTTSIAVFGGAILICLVAALIFKKIDATAFACAAGTVGSFLGVLVGVFAQDGKKHQ